MAWYESVVGLNTKSDFKRIRITTLKTSQKVSTANYQGRVCMMPKIKFLNSNGDAFPFNSTNTMGSSNGNDANAMSTIQGINYECHGSNTDTEPLTFTYFIYDPENTFKDYNRVNFVAPNNYGYNFGAFRIEISNNTSGDFKMVLDNIYGSGTFTFWESIPTIYNFRVIANLTTQGDSTIGYTGRVCQMDKIFLMDSSGTDFIFTENAVITATTNGTGNPYYLIINGSQECGCGSDVDPLTYTYSIYDLDGTFSSFNIFRRKVGWNYNYNYTDLTLQFCTDDSFAPDKTTTVLEHVTVTGNYPFDFPEM